MLAGVVLVIVSMADYRARAGIEVHSSGRLDFSPPMRSSIFRSFQEYSRSGRLRILFEDNRSIWIYSRAASPKQAQSIADRGGSRAADIIREIFSQQKVALQNKLNTVNKKYKDAQMKLFGINSQSLTARSAIAKKEQTISDLEKKLQNQSKTTTVIEIDENELWSARLEKLETEARDLKKELDAAEKKDPAKALRLIRILEDLIPDEIDSIRENIIKNAKSRQRNQTKTTKTRIAEVKEALDALKQKATLARDSARKLSRDIRDILEEKDVLEQALIKQNSIRITSRPAADFDVTRRWRPDMSWRFWTGAGLIMFGLLLLLIPSGRSDVLWRTTDIQFTDLVFPVAGSAASPAPEVPKTGSENQCIQDLIERMITQLRTSYFCVLGNDTELDKKRWTQDLAFAMAKTGKRTLLLDLDLFGSGVYRRLGCTNDTGVTAYLNEQIDISLSPGNPLDNQTLLRKIVQSSGIDGLEVIARGPDDPGCEELYKSSNLSLLIRGAVEYADIVIIEAPSLDHREDIALQLANLCSSSIVFCRTGRTNVRRLNSFLDRLRRKNPKFAVAVEGGGGR